MDATNVTRRLTGFAKTLILVTATAAAGGSMFPFRPAEANHVPYTLGDVFASVQHFDSGTGVSHNTVRRYSSTGVLIETLDTGATNYTAAGSCFDGSGQLRVTNFSDDTVTLFGAPGTGTTTYPWVSGISADPESCRVENLPSGNVFVGVADGDRNVRKYAPGGGPPLATYSVATENRGSDWVDLLPTDNCQLYYTSEGVLIKRFNVCTNTQLADFATVPSGGPCYAIRARTDGHVFVACTDRVLHLDATGANVPPSPYLESSLVAPSGGAETGTLFAMNLDPDNATLWTGGLETGNIYRINIATGLQVTTFKGFQAGDNTLGGLTIFGEIGPPPPAPPASCTLSPPTATNPVDSSHTVTAKVTDATGNPVSGQTVLFTVTGAVNTTGSCKTGPSGTCSLTYPGPALPGADAITACVDTDRDGRPCDTSDLTCRPATKVWTVPASTAFCTVDITYGGWITAQNGDRANFGGNASADEAGNPSGQEEYQDKGPVAPMNVHSINVLAVTCTTMPPPAKGSIFGQATIDGSGSHAYRIDVQDGGKGVGKYQIRLDTGYDSGNETLSGGQITIHK